MTSNEMRKKIIRSIYLRVYGKEPSEKDIDYSLEIFSVAKEADEFYLKEVANLKELISELLE